MPHFLLCYNANMDKIRSYAVVGASFVLLAAPALVAADIIPTIVPSSCTGVNCTCDDLAQAAQNVINASIFIAVFLSAVLFAWAGWKLLSGKSVGSHGAIQEGKEVFWNVVVGLAIIIAAWLVVDTLVGTLTEGGALQGAWNSVCGK